MHNYKSALWVLALISITLAPPGVHAQNDEPDLDTHRIPSCAIAAIVPSSLDVQRSGQGSDVTAPRA
jgi:hypothetical protein